MEKSKHPYFHPYYFYYTLSAHSRKCAPTQRATIIRIEKLYTTKCEFKDIVTARDTVNFGRTSFWTLNEFCGSRRGVTRGRDKITARVLHCRRAQDATFVAPREATLLVMSLGKVWQYNLNLCAKLLWFQIKIYFGVLVWTVFGNMYLIKE